MLYCKISTPKAMKGTSSRTDVTYRKQPDEMRGASDRHRRIPPGAAHRTKIPVSVRPLRPTPVFLSRLRRQASVITRRVCRISGTRKVPRREAREKQRWYHGNAKNGISCPCRASGFRFVLPGQFFIFGNTKITGRDGINHADLRRTRRARTDRADNGRK